MGELVRPRKCARRGPELGFQLRNAPQWLVTSLLIRPSAFRSLTATPGEGHLDPCNMKPAHVRVKGPRAAEASGQGHGCFLPWADPASPLAQPSHGALGAQVLPSANSLSSSAISLNSVVLSPGSSVGKTACF